MRCFLMFLGCPLVLLLTLRAEAFGPRRGRFVRCRPAPVCYPCAPTPVPCGSVVYTRDGVPVWSPGPIILAPPSLTPPDTTPPPTEPPAPGGPVVSIWLKGDGNTDFVEYGSPVVDADGQHLKIRTQLARGGPYRLTGAFARIYKADEKVSNDPPDQRLPGTLDNQVSTSRYGVYLFDTGPTALAPRADYKVVIWAEYELGSSSFRYDRDSLRFRLEAPGVEDKVPSPPPSAGR